MERRDFVRLLRQTLNHLHNPAYLESHALATFFGDRSRPLNGNEIRRVLIEAIEQLKPARTTPSTLSDWRRYRHVVLRCVEGYGLDRVARELGTSERQASRDFHQGVDALATLMWRRHTAGRTPSAAMTQDWSTPHPDAASETHAIVGDTTTTSEIGTPVSETIVGVVATLRKLIPDRGWRPELSLPDTLAPVAIDQALLRQALLHLLSYVRAVAGDVRVTGAEFVGGVCIRIELSPRDSRRRVGRPSARDEAEARDLLETGRQLLKTGGASVEVEGGVDQPRRLSITLPVNQRPVVLVVDDNPQLVQLFRRFLRGGPYRFVQATSGETSLQLARDLCPDLVILDVMLPSRDGWDILDDLRGTPGLDRTPVVICSVLPERALAHSLAMADFLPKPVTRPALLGMLERWCPVPPARRVPN